MPKVSFIKQQVTLKALQEASHMYSFLVFSFTSPYKLQIITYFTCTHAMHGVMLMTKFKATMKTGAIEASTNCNLYWGSSLMFYFAMREVINWIIKLLKSKLYKRTRMPLPPQLSLRAHLFESAFVYFTMRLTQRPWFCPPHAFS